MQSRRTRTPTLGRTPVSRVITRTERIKNRGVLRFSEEFALKPHHVSNNSASIEPKDCHSILVLSMSSINSANIYVEVVASRAAKNCLAGRRVGKP